MWLDRFREIEQSGPEYTKVSLRIKLMIKNMLKNQADGWSKQTDQDTGMKTKKEIEVAEIRKRQ